MDVRGGEGGREGLVGDCLGGGEEGEKGGRGGGTADMLVLREWIQVL